MPETTWVYLIGLAAFTGVVHTVMGPDHYVPFIVMAQSRRWSLTKTLAVTLACGLAHVLSSVLLGAIGVAVGLAVGGLNAVEAARAEVAGWLLLGFGLAYTVWGIRRAILDRPHGHLHLHADGIVHRHPEGHIKTHTHEHTEEQTRSTLTTWTLFTIFIFGPCEPLIPQLMYPAATRSWWGLWVVVAVFALATIGTMTVVVAAGYAGLKRIPLARLERYTHAAAGLAIVVCGLAIKMGL